MFDEEMSYDDRWMAKDRLRGGFVGGRKEAGFNLSAPQREGRDR